jgi:hypothetical protein
LHGQRHFSGLLHVQLPSECGVQLLLLAVQLLRQLVSPDQLAEQPDALHVQDVVYHWQFVIVPWALLGSWQAQPLMNWLVPLVHGAVVFHDPPEYVVTGVLHFGSYVIVPPGTNAMHGLPLHVYVRIAPLNDTVVFTFVLNPVQVRLLPNHNPSLFDTEFAPHENVSGVPNDIKSALTVALQKNANTITAAKVRIKRKRIVNLHRANKEQKVYFSAGNLHQITAESRFKSQRLILNLKIYLYRTFIALFPRPAPIRPPS